MLECVHVRQENYETRREIMCALLFKPFFQIAAVLNNLLNNIE